MLLSWFQAVTFFATSCRMRRPWLTALDMICNHRKLWCPDPKGRSCQSGVPSSFLEVHALSVPHIVYCCFTCQCIYEVSCLAIHIEQGAVYFASDIGGDVTTVMLGQQLQPRRLLHIVHGKHRMCGCVALLGWELVEPLTSSLLSDLFLFPEDQFGIMANPCQL